MLCCGVVLWGVLWGVEVVVLKVEVVRVEVVRVEEVVWYVFG